MKITICGSVNFAKEMLRIAKELEAKGHEVVIPASINKYGIVDSEEADALKNDREKYIKEIKPGLTKEHFNKILNGDAILVVNIDKKGINYK